MAPRFILGIIIVLVGVSLLLDQLGIQSADHVTRFWPIILVAVGFLSLSRGRRGSVTGVVLIFLGGWLLLNTLGWLMLSPWEFIVPIAVVAVGARVMMRSSDHSNWRPPTGGPLRVVRRVVRPSPPPAPIPTLRNMRRFLACSAAVAGAGDRVFFAAPRRLA